MGNRRARFGVGGALLRFAACALLTATNGCGNGSTAPAPPGRTETSLEPTTPAELPVGSHFVTRDVRRGPAPWIVSVIGGPDWIHTRWQPVDPPPEFYTVTLTPQQGDTARRSIQVPGHLNHTRITDLPSRVTYDISIHTNRSVGTEPRSPELTGTTAPMIFVDGTSASPGDGTTPQRPLATIADAVASAIALEHSTICVAAGTYTERVFLFDGMRLAGGFDPTFTPERRHQPNQPTILRAPDEADLVSVGPGRQWCGLDGLQLEAGMTGRRALVAADCRLEISDCKVSGGRQKSIELRSGDEQDDQVEVRLVHCDVRDSGGEGVALEGQIAASLRHCVIENHAQEGVEVEPFTYSEREKGELLLEDCVLANNRDLGLDLALARHPHAPGGKARIRISRTIFRNNDDHGASIDLPKESGDCDVRVNIDDCTFIDNLRSGLSIEADHAGAVSVDRSLATGNGEFGLRVSGDEPTFLLRLRDGTIGDNGVADLWSDALGSILLVGTRMGSSEVSSSWVGHALTAPPSAWSSGDVHRQDLERIVPRPGSALSSRVPTTMFTLDFRRTLSDAVVVEVHDKTGPRTVETVRDGKRLVVRLDPRRIEGELQLRVTIEGGPTYAFEYTTVAKDGS